MRSIKRIATSMTATFSSFMDRVENHEALVSQAMKEVASASAQAQARLKRVQEDEAKLESQLVELKKAEAQWTERAIQAGAEDETRALECVRRLNHAKEHIKTVETQARKHGELRIQLLEDIRSIQKKLEDLRRRKHTLATRQYRAEAMKALQDEGQGTMEELSEIFERWEAKVSETEIHGACDTNLVDTFEKEYVEKEDKEALRKNLQELLERHRQ